MAYMTGLTVGSLKSEVTVMGLSRMVYASLHHCEASLVARRHCGAFPDGLRAYRLNVSRRQSHTQWATLELSHTRCHHAYKIWRIRLIHSDTLFDFQPAATISLINGMRSIVRRPSIALHGSCPTGNTTYHTEAVEEARDSTRHIYCCRSSVFCPTFYTTAMC